MCAKKTNYRVASIAPKRVRKDWNEDTNDSASHKHISTLKDVQADSEDEFHTQRDQVQLTQYEHEILSEQSEVEVLALDSEESEDSSEYDDEETDRMDRLSKQLLPKAAFSDDDQAEVDEHASDASDSGWGQSRKSFYSNEQVAQDDAQVAHEEELEALRIQQRQSSRIATTDYIDDSFAALLKKRLDDTAYYSGEDDKDEEKQAEEGIFDVEGLEESGLNEKERASVLASIMPEVPELIEDFKERHLEYQMLELPSLTHLQLTKKTSYLMNLSFYFMLKVDDRLEKRGKSQQDHPVVGVLIELRDMLDAVAEVECGDEESGKESIDSDALDAMLEDEMQSDSEIEGEIIESNGEKMSDEQDMSEEGEGFSEMSGSELDELLASEKQAKPLLTSHKPLFSHALESLPSFSTSSTARVKKQKNKVKQLDDFGEEDEQDNHDVEVKRKSLKFHVTRIDKNITSRVRKSNKFGGDDDIPIKLKRTAPDASALNDSDPDTKPQKKQKQAQLPSAPTHSSASDNDYETLKQSKSLLKLQKRDAYTAKLALQITAAEPTLLPNQKRGIDYQIQANKGLTPHRPKIDRNPRVKRRVKYESAMKKLKDFRRVAVDKGSLGQYVGEASGIKTKLARSVKL